MGRVRLLETGEDRWLRAWTRVGRLGQQALAGDLVVPDAVRTVSRHHAEVRWDGDLWVLVPSGLVHVGDVAASGPTPLADGDVVGLPGLPRFFQVIETSPPRVFASHRVTGEEVWGDDDDRLHLPVGFVWEDVEEGWVCDGGAGPRPCGLEIGDWRICAPGLEPARTLALERTLATAIAEFSLDRFGTPGLTLKWAEDIAELGFREEFVPLYQLALEQRASGDGLVAVEDLCQRCVMTRRRLDVYLSRAKVRVAAARVADAEDLYEAPRGHRRLGLPASRIVLPRP